MVCRKAGLRASFVGRSAIAIAAGSVVLFTASAAWAHVDPDPLAVQSGSAATVGFTVEHGCTGSPTTGLKIQVPAQIADARPVDKSGWTTSTAAGVVSFTGGPLAPDTAEKFEIIFTAPKDAGTVAFNIVQTCAKGQINWIEPTIEGQPEPEHPAAVLKITAGAPTAADLTAADAAKTDAPSASTSSNRTPWVVGGGVVALIAALGGWVVTRRRRKSAAAT